MKKDKNALNALLAGRRTAPVPGRPGWTLRLLSAAEVLQARREADGLAAEEKERAVCSNACLLARALERDGEPVFPSGAAALEGLQIGEIAALSERWAAFNAEENNIDFTGEELLKLIEGVGSPYVGADLDTGNFLRLLDDPLHAADILAEHTIAVHLKDVQVNPKEARPTDWYFFSCVPIGQGLVDNEAILTTLRRAGYDGYIGVDIDHPHTDWYGREDEMVELSVRAVKELIDNAG